MRAYLDACPSKSFTLRDLGSRLHSFLAEHEELTVPKSRLAQDVVRLEWAHIEAYDAATMPPPAPEFFASITDETVLRLQPCIRLLDFSYPVDELLIAVRQDAGSNDTSSNNATATRKIPAVRRVAQLAPSPIWLAVHRQEFPVYYKRLQPEYRILTTIQSGAALRAALAAVFNGREMVEAAQAGYLNADFQPLAVLG